MMNAWQRKRLIHLRDVVIPNIDDSLLAMDYWSCGTYRCIAGWAAEDKKLKRAGLHLVGNDIRFKEFDLYVALSEFFGLNETQAVHLFGPRSYRDKRGFARTTGPHILGAAKIRIDNIIQEEADRGKPQK